MILKWMILAMRCKVLIILRMRESELEFVAAHIEQNSICMTRSDAANGMNEGNINIFELKNPGGACLNNNNTSTENFVCH